MSSLGNPRTLVACVALIVSAPSAAAAADVACQPWAGEPDPLPSVASDSPRLAEWARLRARELEDEARFLETSSYADARIMWEHVLCLDPESSAARAGLDRTGPLQAAAPPPPVPAVPPAQVLEGDLPAPAPAEERAADAEPAAAPEEASPAVEPAPDEPAAAEPEAPPAVSAPPPDAAPADATGSSDRDETAAPEPASETSELGGIDGELDDIEALVRQAHFRAAISVAASTHELLAAGEPDDALRARRARLGVLMATAQIALGRQSDARVSMVEAIRSQPDLQLDPASVSPKVIRLLEEVRGRPVPSPWDEPREDTAAGAARP
jgi:hypothetical protein